MKNCIDCAKELSEIESDSIYLDGKNGVLCLKCSNARVLEYRKERKAWGEKNKADGLKFWADRNIKIGDKVSRFVQNALCGGVVMYGIAKSGAKGAYVVSDMQAGHLTPRGWTKV